MTGASFVARIDRASLGVDLDLRDRDRSGTPALPDRGGTEHVWFAAEADLTDRQPN